MILIKLTALVTAERALSILKLISESVRAVSEHESASSDDTAVKGKFTSITAITEISKILDFSTET